jgi:hypothetical protein
VGRLRGTLNAAVVYCGGVGCTVSVPVAAAVVVAVVVAVPVAIAVTIVVAVAIVIRTLHLLLPVLRWVLTVCHTM